MKIDTPFNARSYRNSLFTFSPKMMANRNQFFPGDDAYFLSWKGKKLVITGRNTAPDA